jgi:hypothetical protein
MSAMGVRASRVRRLRIDGQSLVPGTVVWTAEEDEPSNPSVPSSGSPNNSSSMPAGDQLFASFTLFLNDMRSAYQAQLPSISALWQSLDALALQRLDALLSIEAGAMGVTKDTLMRDLFFASLFTPNDM